MNEVVAVTAPRRVDADGARVALNEAYVRALARAGLVPLVVPPMLDPGRVPLVLDHVAGLVLTGGEDVDPARYRAVRHPKLEEPDPARDAVEAALIAGAHERGLPILGICRGMQLLNVVLGGTLYQDLPSERPGPIDHADEAGRHEVTVERASLLHRAVRAPAARVNSRHHQAVRDLARGLHPTAWAADGVIEAVESNGGGGGAWTLGVQWHPEDDPDDAVLPGFAAALR